MQRDRLSYTVALLAAAALAGGCEPEQDIPQDVDLADDGEQTEQIDVVNELASLLTPLETLAGWTPWTSEERPPVGCDSGSLVNQFGCSGGWCDNVRLYCVPTGQAAGGSYWSDYFSEEGNSSRQCADGHWMSGIACKGDWCDNVSIQCTAYPNTSPKNCYWTGWISEESGGTLYFGPDYYARGMQCQRGYCDNQRFLVCQP